MEQTIGLLATHVINEPVYQTSFVFAASISIFTVNEQLKTNKSLIQFSFKLQRPIKYQCFSFVLRSNVDPIIRPTIKSTGVILFRSVSSQHPWFYQCVTCVFSTTVMKYTMYPKLVSLILGSDIYFKKNVDFKAACKLWFLSFFKYRVNISSRYTII